MLPFLELDLGIVKDMVTVNITAATYLCHQVIVAILYPFDGLHTHNW